jgi:Arc/MetJ family transcription regulator
MRVNLELDDHLLTQAMRITGLRAKRATIEAGLRLLIQTHFQTDFRNLRGKVQWHGDLNRSRLT